MNPWLDFLITVLVRFTVGAVLGGIGFTLFGLRRFLGELAHDHFPIGWLTIWALIGGTLCILTTPRDSRPWVK